MVITLDATSSGQNDLSNTLTFSHTIGTGNKRYLVVGVGREDGSTSPVTGITYDGVAMTLIRSEVTDTTGTRGLGSMFYMDETDLPSAGAYDIVVTWSSSATNRQNRAYGISRFYV